MLLKGVEALRHPKRRLAEGVLASSGDLVAEDIESIAGCVASSDGEPSWFVVTYSDGDEEHRKGTLVEASRLADQAGLIMIPTHGRAVRWVRNPEL